MTNEEATELLGFHSGRDDRINECRWQYGFLGSLRPYTGLRERNFHEVMACVKTVSGRLQSSSVPRELMSDLWAICFFGQLWGVHPDGMLRRNSLIPENDVKRLDGWTATIGFAVHLLIDTDDHIVPAPDDFGYELPPEWEDHLRARS